MSVKDAERDASMETTWPRRRYERWEGLSREMKGRILKVLMDLRGLKPRTLNQYGEFLVRLAEMGDLHNVEETQKMVAWLPAWMQKMRAAYRHYCRVHRLPEPKIYMRTVDGRRNLPRLPPERTLQASVAVPRSAKWRAYLRLLYETGPRPTEGLSVRVRDLDLEREMIRLGTGKSSGDTTEREIPISPLLASMLKELIRGKDQGDPVFSMLHDPSRPNEYRAAERLMERVRAQLKDSGYDTQGLRLHIYRHAFGTRLYQGTKDLPLVMRSLGHRDLKTTMIYVHIQPGTPRLYDVKPVALKETAMVTSCISEGWEIALRDPEQGLVYFRRPRWLP